MKPRRRVLYKLCWDRRGAVYFGHHVSGTLRAAVRRARALERLGWSDLNVLLVTKGRSRDVTNKVLGRPGANPFVT